MQTSVLCCGLRFGDPSFPFRAGLLFGRCGLSCAFNFAKKDYLVQGKFHTMLVMNISRFEFANLEDACCT